MSGRGRRRCSTQCYLHLGCPTFHSNWYQNHIAVDTNILGTISRLGPFEYVGGVRSTPDASRRKQPLYLADQLERPIRIGGVALKKTVLRRLREEEHVLKRKKGTLTQERRLHAEANNVSWDNMSFKRTASSRVKVRFKCTKLKGRSWFGAAA